MAVPVLVLLAIAPSPDLYLQTARADSLPDLPHLNMDNFHPAVRQQVQQVYAAAEMNPKNPDASGKLGMVLDAYEQYESAAICYRRAHLLDPGSFRWLFYLGWVLADQGRHQDAVLMLGDALRMKSDYVPAQLKLAESLLAIGKWDEGRDIYHVVSKAHPESAAAYYGLGRVYATRGDLRAAATAYLKSLELFPSYGAAHYALALAYRQLGDETNSQQQFRLYEQNKTARPPSEDSLRRARAGRPDR